MKIIVRLYINIRNFKIRPKFRWLGSRRLKGFFLITYNSPEMTKFLRKKPTLFNEDPVVSLKRVNYIFAIKQCTKIKEIYRILTEVFVRLGKSLSLVNLEWLLSPLSLILAG